MELSQLETYAAAGYNRIPVSKRVISDRVTPVSAYASIKAPFTFLLESLQGGEKWGRYSIIGLPAKTVLRVQGEDIQVEEHGQIVESSNHCDPLAFVEEFQSRFKVPEIGELPVFYGGLVGYFGYDCVRYVEPRLKPTVPKDELHTPDILLLLAEDLLVFDNVASTVFIISHIQVNAELNNDELSQRLSTANARINEIERNLEAATPSLQPLPIDIEDRHLDLKESDFKSDFDETSYGKVVDKVKEYALAGDIMQVVPSQRMRIPFKSDAFSLYRAVRHLNPSPYMYFLELQDFQIVGSSPEILARKEGDDVAVRPIAGTRRRGHNKDEDQALEIELLNDPKEIAEHLMLIDLGRNDVGRVAKIGSVAVTDQMIVERYSHVMHIVSNVVGSIPEEISSIDVLRATLPAGTLSGAPKVRAMEIIDEVEPVKRGIYGGAIGYISWADNMDTAIAIRTAVVKGQTLYVQAGGGVVADSIPRLEWKETMNKARAMIRAAALASQNSSSTSSSDEGGAP